MSSRQSLARAADYEGIQSPAGILKAGVNYTFSMKAKLPDGTAGTSEIRFVVKPNYNWVANTTIDGNGWTTVSGTYTLRVLPSPGNGNGRFVMGVSDSRGILSAATVETENKTVDLIVSSVEAAAGIAGAAARSISARQISWHLTALWPRSRS